MTPRAKGRVWRYASLVILGMSGGAVITFVLHGPWHEMILWGFIAGVLADRVGVVAEAAMTGSYREREVRRQLRVDRAVIERLEARRREQGEL
jgi:hypothetical protein